MEKNLLGFGSDRLTDLPGNVLDNVLACLPLKDAVRTGALSLKWKEKWHTLPHIIVEENEFTDRQKKEIEGIIHYILNQHKGKIQKFSLSVGRVKGCYNLKSWVWSLSEKGIQELSLKIRRHRYNDVPSDLFCCQQLRKLKLRHFEFKMPLTFRGFYHLVSLHLKEINVDARTFENLIARCPLLEHLVVKDLSCIDHLCINVPNLKYFSFDGEFKSLRLNTPRLAVMHLDLYRIGSTQFDLRFIICGLPLSLEELSIRCPFKKFLNAGNRLIEDSISYSSLRKLELDEFCFKEADEVSYLLSLIGRFPNLQCLDVAACTCMKDGATFDAAILKFWEEDITSACSLNHLQTMKVRSFRGEDPELRFIRFVLANSPVLKEMIIEHTGDDAFVDKSLVTQMMSFRRVSAEVKVNYIAPNAVFNSDNDDSSDYDGDNASDDSYSSDSD